MGSSNEMPEPQARTVAFIDLEAQRRHLGDRVERNLARVLEHGKFVMGPEVQELEERLAERVGVNHVITCSRGTDALTLPLLAWGIGPGDAVFVPSFTFTATAEVVALLGATPVFCDVDPESFNLDPDNLEQAIEAVTIAGTLRPRAVIPVDLFGQPASYPELQAVADGRGLMVLADAAQSFGAHLGGSPVGRFGHATATSFFPAKPLGCYGDGGAVFTDDPDLAEILRSLRVHGKGTDKYDTVRVGLNARLDTMQAAVLLAKLEIFDGELERRDEVARRYSEALVDLVGIPNLPSDRSSAWAQYTIRLEQRDRVASSLRDTGVPTAVYYPRPLHEQPAFADGVLSPGGCYVSSSLAQSVLSLPMHPYLAPSDQDQVVDRLTASLAGAA
jgi:dTDP-4-amino-4,6-dideoxygalactose transaminase